MSLVFCFLLASSLQLPASAFAGDRDAQMQQARQLSWDKKYDESIALYERLVKKNPKDIEAAIGLATATAWSGDHQKAVGIYEGILKNHPGDREALLGLGRVLSWQGKYKESLERFDALLVAKPQDPEVLKEKQKVLDAKKSARPFGIRGSYINQQMSFTSSAQGANFLFSYEKSKKWAARAGIDYINKFGDSAPGYRAGGSWWATKDTVLSLDIETAPGQIVVPRQAYTFEISRTIFKKLVPSVSYRFADYATADAHIIAPGFTWYFYPRFDLMARYFLSVSLFGGESFIDHSAMTRINWNLIDPLTLFIGYVRANESFESGNPVVPAGGFSANHVFSGFNWALKQGFGIDFTFDYENRSNDSTLKTCQIGASYRW